MTRRSLMIFATTALFPVAAAAQSGVVAFSADTTTLAPGETATITLSVDSDTGSASSGLFGEPGLFGFGGNIVASGPAASGLVASTVSPNAELAFGATSSTSTAGALVRAAGGRGFAGGLTANPVELLSFELTVPAGVPSGTATLEFEGGVVLALGATLRTLSTEPGTNQLPLIRLPLVLTVASGGCNAADLAEPFGVLDLNDLNAFVSAFVTGDLLADVTGDGVLDLQDISSFVGAFTAGCP
jgi:hypothetical protein